LLAIDAGHKEKGLGDTIGLFALSLAGGEIRDEGRAKLKSTSDCVSGRQPIAGTFGSEVIAFNLPPIQFDNREWQGDRKWPKKSKQKWSRGERRFLCLDSGRALGFALSSALEPVEAEAQEAAPSAAAPAQATGTHGMQRRQGRRAGRHERRHGRHERRHERRTGEKPAAAPPAGTAPAQ
jgi:hypothetical protein